MRDLDNYLPELQRDLGEALFLLEHVLKADLTKFLSGDDLWAKQVKILLAKRRTLMPGSTE